MGSSFLDGYLCGFVSALILAGITKMIANAIVKWRWRRADVDSIPF